MLIYFHGDIANNICLKQECDVLEIVGCKKEYLIKRIFVNECNVNYRKWTKKTEYTNEELQQIGQKTVDLIEVMKRLPTIIEDDFDKNKLVKFVDNYANFYADSEEIETLLVLDIYPLNNETKSKFEKSNNRKNLNIIKRMAKISKKLRCPIFIVMGIDISKKYNTEERKCNYIDKGYINNVDKINKYVDNFIIINGTEQYNIYKLDIYSNNEIIGDCKLRYDNNIRKFVEA